MLKLPCADMQTVSGQLEMRRQLKKEWVPIIQTIRQHDANARILLAGMTPFSTRAQSSSWPNMCPPPPPFPSPNTHKRMTLRFLVIASPSF